MEIPCHAHALLVERVNKYLAIVEITAVYPHADMPKMLAGQTVKAHVHDPGRMKEIFFPQCELILEFVGNRNGTRKTEFDVVAAKPVDSWILINTKFHSRIALEILKSDASPFEPFVEIVPEQKFGSSRFDFAARNAAGELTIIEVKGCTLCENGVALFPDAPTLRGARHLDELAKMARDGRKCAVLIAVFNPKAHSFAPNVHMDPNFARAFALAVESGVCIRPVFLSLIDGHIRCASGAPL